MMALFVLIVGSLFFAYAIEIDSLRSRIVKLEKTLKITENAKDN